MQLRRLLRVTVFVPTLSVTRVNAQSRERAVLGPPAIDHVFWKTPGIEQIPRRFQVRRPR